MTMEKLGSAEKMSRKLSHFDVFLNTQILRTTDTQKYVTVYASKNHVSSDLNYVTAQR